MLEYTYAPMERRPISLVTLVLNTGGDIQIYKTSRGTLMLHQGTNFVEVSLENTESLFRGVEAIEQDGISIIASLGINLIDLSDLHGDI